MLSFRALSRLSALLRRIAVSLPLLLLATKSWAAHAEHPSATELAIQAMLVLFMAALLVNVIISVLAILRDREASDPADRGASRCGSELKPQRPARAPATTTTAAAAELPSNPAPAKQVLSEH